MGGGYVLYRSFSEMVKFILLKNILNSLRNFSCKKATLLHCLNDVNSFN